MKQFNQKAYPYRSFWYDRQKEKNNWLPKFIWKFRPKSELLQRQSCDVLLQNLKKFTEK